MLCNCIIIALACIVMGLISRSEFVCGVYIGQLLSNGFLCRGASVEVSDERGADLLLRLCGKRELCFLGGGWWLARVASKKAIFAANCGILSRLYFFTCFITSAACCADDTICLMSCLKARCFKLSMQ